VKQRFNAPAQGGNDIFAFSRLIPVSGSRNRARVGCETDEDRVPLITFANKLSDVPFAGFAHLSGARIAQMGVMRPESNFYRLVALLQVCRQRLQRFGHVAVAQVP
jgi:hypothetical protein